MDLSNTRTVIVGGGSGIGLAVAQHVHNLGGSVIISSRTKSKLEAAAKEIGERAEVMPLDMRDEAASASWGAALPPIDNLVITASTTTHGAFHDVETSAVRAMFDAKFFGPYLTARSALEKIRPGGSITFFSGVLSRRPSIGASGLAAVNSAVEALAKSLALELAPNIRVNCMSPGLVKSDAYAGMPDETREAMFDGAASSLPLKRVGETEDIAEAVLMLMQNPYLTGVTLDVDGGHLIG